MITKREKKLSKIMIVTQVLISVLTFYCTGFVVSNDIFSFYGFLFVTIQIIVIWSFLLYKFKLGIIFRATGFGNLIRGYIVTIGLGVGIFYSEFFLLSKLQHTSFLPYAEYIAVFALINLISLVVFKLVFYNLMRYMRR